MNKLPFEQIGIVVATFQRVEHLLIRVLAERLDPSDGEFIGAYLCQSKFDGILREVKARTKRDLDPLEHTELFEEPYGVIPRINDIRNEWVHSYYNFDESGDEPRILTRIRARRWAEYEAAATPFRVEQQLRNAISTAQQLSNKDSGAINRPQQPSKIESQIKAAWKKNPAMHRVEIHLPQSDEFRQFTLLAARAINSLTKIIKTEIDPIRQDFMSDPTD